MDKRAGIICVILVALVLTFAGGVQAREASSDRLLPELSSVMVSPNPWGIDAIGPAIMLVAKKKKNNDGQGEQGLEEELTEEGTTKGKKKKKKLARKRKKKKNKDNPEPLPELPDPLDPVPIASPSAP